MHYSQTFGTYSFKLDLHKFLHYSSLGIVHPLGPQIDKNDPNIMSKSNVRIQGIIEKESCLTTWVDPKTEMSELKETSWSWAEPNSVKSKVETVSSVVHSVLTWNLDFLFYSGVVFIVVLNTPTQSRTVFDNVNEKDPFCRLHIIPATFIFKPNEDVVK